MVDRDRNIDADRRAGGFDTNERDTANVLAYAQRLQNAEDDVPTFNDGINATLTEKAEGIMAGDSTDGIIFDLDGIRLYSGGVETVNLDANTGSGTFTGTITGSAIIGGTITGGLIQTASTGARVALDSVTGVDTIKLYSGLTTETTSATIRITNTNPGTSTERGLLTISSPRMSGISHGIAIITMESEAGTGANPTICSVSAGITRFVPSGSNFIDIKFTDHPFIKAGQSGLKFLTSSGVVQVRNSGDTDYSEITAKKLNMAPAYKTTITGSRSSGAALQQLLLALDAAGIIADSSVA